VIVATTPVNAGGEAGPEVVVPEVGVLAGAVLVVSDGCVDVVVEGDAVVGAARRAAFAEPDDPHAPVATSTNIATAPAHR
jgi:hypothetical protein